MDMESPGRDGSPRTRWIDAVHRDMEMVVLERKMADDRRRWQRTVDSQVQYSLDRGGGFSDVDRQIVLLSSHFNK